MTGDDTWIRTLRPRPDARRRFVCFPHAAGSVTFFHGWADLPDDVELAAVQYPGRADRLAEPCHTDLNQLADDVYEALAPSLDRAVTLFGHSMGAVVAYEVARRAERDGHEIDRVVVSASRAPHDPDSVVDLDLVWDDDAAMRSLVSLGGTDDDPELLADPRVRALVLPYLRADYTMLQNHRHVPGPPLRCELLVVRGADDPHVSEQQGDLWRELTTGRFGHEVLPGGHFYLAPTPPVDVYLNPSSTREEPLEMKGRTENRVAVVVDGYTSGNHLPPAFRRLGVGLVHVQSTDELMTTMKLPDLDAYDRNIVGADIDAAVAELRRLDPYCVVAGQEPGVEPADLLSERLGLPGNSTRLSRARRDKYQMIEALRDAGVHCADQIRSGDVEELVAWAERRGTWPVVVKPLASAATDGVVVCSDAEQIRRAAGRLLGTRDIFGGRNDEVLLQSFLDGDEYYVDTVSYAGSRYTCGITRYRKKLVNGHRLYDHDEIVDPEREPVAAEIVSYLDAALRALEIDYGATHAEVIVTADGPALVEVGARTSGALMPSFQNACMGANQADVMALAYTDPERFAAEYAGGVYRKLRSGCVTLGATELSGTVLGIDEKVLQAIEELPTVHNVALRRKPGDLLKPTVDLYTTTFLIHQIADSEEAILADYERLQELKDGLYQLDALPAEAAS